MILLMILFYTLLKIWSTSWHKLPAFLCFSNQPFPLVLGTVRTHRFCMSMWWWIWPFCYVHEMPELYWYSGIVFRKNCGNYSQFWRWHISTIFTSYPVFWQEQLCWPLWNHWLSICVRTPCPCELSVLYSLDTTSCFVIILISLYCSL